MIGNIHLKNFKAFKEVQVPFRAFTLLAGLNGVGKSSLIQSLLLLRQSYQSGELEGGRLTLNGSLTEIGTASDLLFSDAKSDEICIALEHGDASIHFRFTVHLDDNVTG